MASRSRSPVYRLEARPGRVPAVDAAGFLLGAAILAGLRLVPQLISPLAFWLLLAALAAGFGIDLLLWFHRGVRAVELDASTLVLRRGRGGSVPLSIPREAVREVRTRRSWGGRTIELDLRGRGRVRLRDDAFDREPFAELARQLAGWSRGDR